MRTGIEIGVTLQDRKALGALNANRNTPAKVVWRAEIIPRHGRRCWPRRRPRHRRLRATGARARMAKAMGLSHASVQRIWDEAGLKPHRVKRFKLSNDLDSPPHAAAAGERCYPCVRYE